jgi:hypothetical protein
MSDKPITYWEVFQQRLTDYLKSAVVKTALLKFLGPMAGGWQLWLVTFISEYAFEEIAEPIIRLTFRKSGWVYDRIGGDITLKRVKDAKESGDKSKYIIHISGV